MNIQGGHDIVATGRKRKAGRRNSDGRLKRTPLESPAVIASRMPHRQMVPEKHRADHRAESVLGRLYLTGRITEQQYEAGKRFREVTLRFHAVIDAPRPDAISLAGAIVGPWAGSTIMADDEVAQRRQAYCRAYEALEGGSGNKGARAVSSCAVFGRIDFTLEHLLPGLSALAGYFGLRGRSWVDDRN